MPRRNIPYRSKGYFSNRKRNKSSRLQSLHIRSSADSESVDNPQTHVNNIVVFPKYSETTINLLSNNTRILPYGNLLKKIKGRNRKDKQRLKKKQTVEGDVKPDIEKIKTVKSNKMQPKVNQHIIFLSDSEESETPDLHEQANPNKFSESTKNMESADIYDDDVIFVETPAPEIIEIEDSAEPNENTNISDSSNERTSSPDDFLDKAHVNLKSKFDLEPESSVFKRTEFVKPNSAPVDMSESGSISSVSDISATVGMNVFKLIDFPQEKVNLFDGDNLDKFRDAITPKRINKKQVDKNSEDDNLPTLSEIPVETNRNERGRSIIKELVNDRAYVLLSTQKKNKNKKRKTKDESSECIEEENNDSCDTNKKKKKKKSKKRDINETNEEDESLRNTEDDSREKTERSEDVPILKKTKKHKSKDPELYLEDDTSETRKKKSKKNVGEMNANECEQLGNNSERKKKKNRKNSETGIEIVQEIQEEKKKKKSKRNFETSISEGNEIDSHNINVEENEERKKKKVRRISEKSISSDEKICEKQSETIEVLDDNKKKKSRNNPEVDNEVRGAEGKEMYVGKGDEELNTLKEQSDVQETNEEKKKKKNKKAEIRNTVENEIEIQKEDTDGKIHEDLVKIENSLKENTEPLHTSQIPQIHIEPIKPEREEINLTEDTELRDLVKEEKSPEIIEQKSDVDNSSVVGIHNLNHQEKDKDIPKIINVGTTETILVEDIQKINAEHQTNVENDSTLQCIRKRKKESSISESIADSIENKKQKLSVEQRTEQVIEIPERDNKNEDKGENIEDTGKATILVEDSELPEKIEDEAVKNSEISSIPISLTGGPMFVVDNDGNIDMKLVSVFSSNDFSKDVNVSNFNDKNTTWNTDSARFCSFNDSLFNNINKERSLIIVDDQQGASLKDLQSDQNSQDPPPVQAENTEETLIEVKKEPNLEENVEKLDNVVVKMEIDDEEIKEPEPKTPSVALESRPETSAITLETQPKTSSVTSELQHETSSVTFDSLPKTSPSLSVVTAPVTPSIELPNDIEEIVREKDNLDTVKRLCEFLEEVKHPEDVLKKVSLLKQAFSDKNPEPILSKESVEITHDDDDDSHSVLSISSSGSSVICCDENNRIIDVDDDITLANCDITCIENETSETVVETSVNENVESTKEPTKGTEIVGGTPKRHDKTQMLQSTPKVVRRVECEPGTSKNTPSGSKSGIREYRGLDRYEVEDIQDLMADNPNLWRIVAEDVHPIRLPKGKRCIKCRELGHLGYNCPNKFKMPRCPLCGIEGHLDFKCPNRLCIQCGRKTPMMQNVCEHCKHFKNLTCAMCKNRGHPKNKCPDLWRRYHLTVNHGPLVKGSVLKLKEKHNLWCSSCAKSGHVESECTFSWPKSRNYQPLDPRIHFYEDIYKVTPVPQEQDFIQPNLDEVPETSTNLFRESDSSSSTSSDDTSDKKVIDSGIPTEEKLDMDLSSQSASGGLEDLPPDFEVIDEVTEEKNEMKSHVADSEINKFFMTATNEEIKEFLYEEIRLLETSKFDIKNMHMRYFAFVEDNKLPEHKRKFLTKQKEKFFKSVNMLFFGKLQVKAGRVHKDKLKHFLDSPKQLLSNNTRESLCFSYDYIFRNTLHEHVNYKFFLRMLRNKYGHKKWLF